MTELYPLLFEPVLKKYFWGGRNLEFIGRALPSEGRVAESWEIASHHDGMTAVKNGPFKGKTLPELLKMFGEDLVGSNNAWALDRGKFPLMVKLLDADQRLSVQVHPDDDYARQHEGNELGKAEMWVVLWAKPGASIIYGFLETMTPKEFRGAIQQGTVKSHLNKIPVQTDDHVCVPPGTLHAIMEGVVLAEIQQNSNTTYRVYDWNRTDDDGIARELHIEKALDVINFEQIKSELPSSTIFRNNAHILVERLCQNSYFSTERVTFKQNWIYQGCCDGSTLEIWGIIKGEAVVAGEKIAAVQFSLLPAGLGKFSIKANSDSVLLRIFTG